VPLNHLRLWLTLTGRECHVSGLSRGSSTPGHRVSSNQTIINHSLSCRAYSRPCFGTRARIVPEIIASPLLPSRLGWPPPSTWHPSSPQFTSRFFCIGANCKACRHVIDLQLLSVNTTTVSRVSIAPPHRHSHQYFLCDVAFMALPHVLHGMLPGT
jgi:hypothetical protein